VPAETGALTDVKGVALRGILAGALAIEEVGYINAIDLE
jgi:hypothetical protein